MPRIDFEAVERPNFTRPGLLRHPTIPKPMSGMAPRIVMGQEWWDVVRREAYAKNNMRCWACGGEGPLEAHEAYDIDHYNTRMTYLETVALCRDCHRFIHIGRTIGLFARGRISHSAAKRATLHGYDVLKAAGLKCPWETRVIGAEGLPWREVREFFGARVAPDWILKVIRWCDPVPEIPMTVWEDWRLVFNGEEYPPLYKSAEEYTRRFS